MAIVGCFPLWYLLNAVDSSTPHWWVGFVSVVGGIGSGVTGPIVKATLQNVTVPTARGQAFALFNTFDDFGRGLGPVYVAILIRTLGGRAPAFNVAVLGWVLCGLSNLMTFYTVSMDEDRVQSIVASDLAPVDSLAGMTGEQTEEVKPIEQITEGTNKIHVV